MSLTRRLVQCVGVLIAILVLFFATGLQEARGQLWLQTARVVTPVQDGPVQAFLDTAVAVAERRDEIELRRAPSQDETFSVSDLQNRLIDDAGIGIGSANRVFLGYRFFLDSGGEFQEEITNAHFVFRPGPNQNDIPVMYLDAEDEWAREVINKKGTSLLTNEAAMIPFRRHFRFSELAREEETQIVEVAGQTVREGFDERKEALLQKVQRLMYEGLN